MLPKRFISVERRSIVKCTVCVNEQNERLIFTLMSHPLRLVEYYFFSDVFDRAKGMAKRMLLMLSFGFPFNVVCCYFLFTSILQRFDFVSRLFLCIITFRMNVGYLKRWLNWNKSNIDVVFFSSRFFSASLIEDNSTSWTDQFRRLNIRKYSDVVVFSSDFQQMKDYHNRYVSWLSCWLHRIILQKKTSNQSSFWIGI